jgi:hypothetical protein
MLSLGCRPANCIRLGLFGTLKQEIADGLIVARPHHQLPSNISRRSWLFAQKEVLQMINFIMISRAHSDTC